MPRFVLILAVILAGCTTTTPAPANTPTPGPTTTASIPGSTVVPVMVKKTGGFAGVNITIEVDVTGKWTKGANGGRLTKDQMTQLQRLATSPGFGAEATTTPGPHTCADTFQYVVTAGTLTVLYDDCQTDKPVVARQIVGLLEAAAAQ